MEEDSSSTLTSKSSKSSRFSRTIHRVIHLRSSRDNKTATGNNGSGGRIGICILPSDNKSLREESSRDKLDHDTKAKQRAVLEAVAARLFAGASAIKAAYAELQLAQCPYDGAAVQASDRAVVDELRAISELKRKFLRRELDISPQVTLMLAEIQEQQSLIRTYEITIKKMEAESDAKGSNIAALRSQLTATVSGNKAIEKKLNASGCLSVFDGFRIGSLGPNHFVQVLHFALRSVRGFVRIMVKEMESAKWDLDEAVKFIEPDAQFAKPGHRLYAFESFVCKSIFEGFNFPNFMLPMTDYSAKKQGQSQHHFFEQFKRMKSLNPKQCIAQNPNTSFAKFTRAKYLAVVHAKMECSLFGNLSLRKLVTSGGCPAESEFFTSFAEMCRRVWVLHCLAFSFDDQEVSVFQARRNSRFSEVFMESVTEDVLCSDSGDPEFGCGGGDGDGSIRVGFTVVPGFKIGRNVVQCQVYLSPVGAPVSR